MLELARKRHGRSRTWPRDGGTGCTGRVIDQRRICTTDPTTTYLASDYILQWQWLERDRFGLGERSNGAHGTLLNSGDLFRAPAAQQPQATWSAGFGRGHRISGGPREAEERSHWRRTAIRSWPSLALRGQLAESSAEIYASPPIPNLFSAAADRGARCRNSSSSA